MNSFKKHIFLFLVFSPSLLICPLQCFGGSITISWTGNNEPDLQGYYLYYGTSSGNYGAPHPLAANLTSYEITGLNAGNRYYIALSAYDFSDNESVKCPEISGIAQSVTTSSSTSTSSTTTPPSTTTIPVSTTTSVPSQTTISPTTSIPGNSNILPPPTGSITINDGQLITSSPNVILSLSAITGNGEPLSRNGEMSFSNDNQVWSDPEPFSEEKAWILTAGEGNKTVYALFGDADGNWMTVPAQDEIMYEASQNTCTQGIQLSAASISVSSEFLPFFAKENAIDGDPSTSWSTFFRLFHKEEFYTIDFGEVKNITSLSMYSSRMFGTDLFPTNFQIQVSNDNVTWLDMDTIQGYSRPLDEGSPDNWQYNGLACRFLKVSITKCQTFLFFFRVAQIAEIEVYGCDRDDQVPLISDKKRYIQKKDYPQKSTDSERPPVEQQVPGIPGKPVIKFLN